MVRRRGRRGPLPRPRGDQRPAATGRITAALDDNARALLAYLKRRHPGGEAVDLLAGIADGRDGLRFPCSCRAGSTERHQFGAGATGEMGQADRDVDVTALVADGSTDGVHLAVTVLVDDLGVAAAMNS